MKQIPTKAYLWQNGMLMVFDGEGQQVAEYQGKGTDVLPGLLKDYPDIDLAGAVWTS